VIIANVKGNIAPVHKAIIALGAKQVPFANSLALNTLAKGVTADEVALIDRTFETPTPFTEKAYRIEVATKSKPIAVVAAKDIQASYLEPYVMGGERSLGGKRGMIAPRNVSLNQYGNLTKGKLATLRGKPNVFIGAIKTRSGRTINGVWQRPTSGKRKASAAGGLKLLIQFEDTTPVKKRLPFEQRARRYLDRHTRAAFDDAFRRAFATATK
jgi:hypothetical protein